jgi:uncharacterized lipoprotein
MICTIRWVALALTAAVAGGCGLLPDAYTSCSKPQTYEAAAETAPLKVPAGSDLPDTRNALKIPAVTAPERPKDAASCVDHPPSYGAARPQSADLPEPKP